MAGSKVPKATPGAICWVLRHTESRHGQNQGLAGQYANFIVVGGRVHIQWFEEIGYCFDVCARYSPKFIEPLTLLL